MKKLITGAVASLALLFGFASCSGDLHDNDVQPLTITGLCGTAVVPMELVNADGSLQKLTFKVSEDTKIKSLDSKNPEYALKDGWGGISNINFKLIHSDAVGANYEPTWSMDFGGPKDNDLYLSATKSESYTQLKSRAEFSSGFPSNIHISGTIVNEEYTIWAKYNAASQSCSVWISGAASDPAEVRLTAGDNSKSFPAKDKDGKDVTYKMEKAGSAYTYTFIAKADEALNLSFENDLAGTLSKALTLTTVKNVEYKITVDVSKGISNPTVKYEVVSLLKNATIEADWKYAGNSYETEKIDGKEYYVFKADRTSFDFTVNRIAGDSTKAWGADSKTSISVGDEFVTLKYVDIADTPKETVGKITLSNLTIGNWYKFVFGVESEVPSLTVKVENTSIPEMTKFGSYLWSNVNNSSRGQDTSKYPYKTGFPKFEENSGTENSWYCDFSPYSSEVEFGLKIMKEETENPEKGDWIGTGVSIEKLNEDVPSNRFDNTGNGKIKNLTAGNKYRLYVTFNDPANVILKVVEQQ